VRRALALAAVVLAAACASSAPPELTGTVSYRERMALPPGAVVRVTLLDVSALDMPARVIAKQELHPDHEAPIPFTLRYDPKEIEPGRRYGLRAEIEDATGQTLFATALAEPVLTGHAAGPVELWVQRVAAQKPVGPRVFAYDCAGLDFRVEVTEERALLFLAGRTVKLDRVPSGSGAKYSDGTTTFWSKGPAAQLVADGVEHTDCKQRARPFP